MDIQSLFVIAVLCVRLSTHLMTSEPAQCCSSNSFLYLNQSVLWNQDRQHMQEVWENGNCTDWLLMAEITGHIWLTQNYLLNQTISVENMVVVVIFHNTTWQAARALEDIVSKSLVGVRFMYYNFEDLNINVTSLDVLVKLNKINSIFLLADDVHSTSVFLLLDYLSSNFIFKWTSLIHTAEWTIVSNSAQLLDTLVSNKSWTIDFITLITLKYGYDLNIAQKSRKQDMTVLSKWKLMNYCTKEVGSNCTLTSGEPSFVSLKSKIRLVHSRGKLRPSALIYLQSQKSVLDGLHVPVSLFLTEEKFVSRRLVNNTSVFDGYCIALLDLFASSMGFTYQVLLVADGEYYGAGSRNGKVTGITGNLARREAALTTMPIAMIQDRMDFIDIVPVPAETDVPTFIYRLPHNDIDKTYIYIIKTPFFLICLGPLLVAVILGAVLHLATDSCTLAAPRMFAKRDLRKLNSFPDHVCFHAGTDYAGQSGRILKASWSVMCFILVTAYSAYLTSTFTVTSPELKIKTFKDLLGAQGYQFGIHGQMSALKVSLSNSDDPLLKQAWGKLIKMNETDQNTFSENSSYHTDRVAAGGYVSISSAAACHITRQRGKDIRCYIVYDIPGITSDYIGLPKNTFYKDAFYNIAMSLQESMIIKHLQEKFLKVEVQNKKVINEKNVVQFSRLELTVYVVICGVGISIVCLMLETAWCKYNMHLLLVKLKSSLAMPSHAQMGKEDGIHKNVNLKVRG